MSRLMPASATTDQGNFILIDLFLRNHFEFRIEIQLGMRQDKPVTHFPNQSLRLVYYFFHLKAPYLIYIDGLIDRLP
ncbi:hypothetical protein D3C81_2193280 [compost metagenome]